MERETKPNGWIRPIRDDMSTRCDEKGASQGRLELRWLEHTAAPVTMVTGMRKQKKIIWTAFRPPASPRWQDHPGASSVRRPGAFGSSGRPFSVATDCCRAVAVTAVEYVAVPDHPVHGTALKKIVQLLCPLRLLLEALEPSSQAQEGGWQAPLLDVLVAG